MITVIHLRDSAFVGGPEKLILGQSTRLDRSRFRPVIVSFSASRANALTQAAGAAGIQAECLPDGKLSFVRAVRRLRALLRESENPVVVSSGFKADFTAMLARGRESVPWIAWFHGFTAATPRVRVYEALDMRVLKRAQRVIAICERTQQKLKSCGLTNVAVVPNAIDVAAVRSVGDRHSARSQLGISEDELAVGVVSRLSREKGLDVLLDSAVDVINSHPGVKLILVGDGPVGCALRQQAEALNISDKILFAGLREDAVSLMKGFDVFVLPSLRENVPIALLEAMACGISVVATDVGGVREVLDQTSVEPIAPGSPDAIAKAVSALLDDQTLRRANGAALAHRVEAFSFERHVSLMEAIYDEVVLRLAASATRTEAACQSGGRPYRGE